MRASCYSCCVGVAAAVVEPRSRESERDEGGDAEWPGEQAARCCETVRGSAPGVRGGGGEVKRGGRGRRRWVRERLRYGCKGKRPAGMGQCVRCSKRGARAPSSMGQVRRRTSGEAAVQRALVMSFITLRRCGQSQCACGENSASCSLAVHNSHHSRSPAREARPHR